MAGERERKGNVCSAMRISPCSTSLKDSSTIIPAIQGDIVKVFEPEQGQIDGTGRWWERSPNRKRVEKGRLKLDKGISTFSLAVLSPLPIWRFSSTKISYCVDFEHGGRVPQLGGREGTF